MDLLLDVDIVVDLLAHPGPLVQDAADALDRCHNAGFRIWLYTGSVQTLEYLLAKELSRSIPESIKILLKRSRLLLRAFCEDKEWLASLAGEGGLFDNEDPEQEQLIRALDRFAPGSIKILTRDSLLRRQYPQLTVTPADYLKAPLKPKKFDFMDLQSQQQRIRPALEKNVHRVLHHGQYIMGPEVTELEEKLADYAGVTHCITVSSGTDSLLIALMALGVGPGDEVITSPFTFIATAEMIALTGAIPVFVDIDPRTYTLDPRQLEAAITLRTKAVMPVSLYGQCADFDAIVAIAAKHKLPVIEDGAQSFGATHKGRRSCALSTVGSTSFFPSKPLGCYGDGGALFTNDDSLAKTMREIRVHGQEKRYQHPRLGINGRLDTLQAAVLLAKLELFDDEVKARRRIAARYSELLGGSSTGDNRSTIILPYVEPYNSSVYAQYTLQVDNRESVQKELMDKGIPTAVHYPVPLHLQPVFSGCVSGERSFPVAEDAARKVISLPMHPYLTDERIVFIADSVRRATL